MILLGDCRETLKQLPDRSVHMCVTSPPYFGLRNYDAEDQIGQEQTPEDFIRELVAVFREVYRVLRDDGTLWVVIGDSYARNPSKGGSGPGGKNENRWGYGIAQNAKIGSSDGVVGRAARPGTRAQGPTAKQLLGIPWRLAFALQADGWYLRQDIIWSKPNPMPESVTDRCTKAHEYVFMLSKSSRYYYDSEAIKEPAVSKDRKKWTDGGSDKQRGHGRRHAGFNGRYAERIADEGPPETRNRRSVWNVATKPFRGAHFATYPPELIEPCVLAGSPAGGVVLDSFFGAGTTGLVAQKHGRRWIGCEVNVGYADMARVRLGGIRNDFRRLGDAIDRLTRAL